MWLKRENVETAIYLCIIVTVTHYTKGASYGEEIICIGSRNANNCSVFQPDFQFLTFPQAENIIGTTLLLVDSMMTLSKQLQVIGYNRLRIQANTTSGTTIICSPNVGLQFTAVNNLVICGITFSNCGGIFNTTSMNEFGPIPIKVALYMTNCTNVELANIVLDNSIGSGLVIYDCTGNFNILNSNFTNNYVHSTYESGGGGLYIEFSECSPEWITNCDSSSNQFNNNAVYHIDNCRFVNNTRTRAKKSYRESITSATADRNGQGGGGMSIWTRGYSMNNSFEITKCFFYDNKATYGGGLYFHFQQESCEQALSVVDTVFQNNEAIYVGGGMDIGSLFTDTMFPKFITVNVNNCQFLGNKANTGGGTSVFSSLTQKTDLVNKIMFTNSLWKGNSAKFAYAMNLRSIFLSHFTSHFTTSVLISDCTFVENVSTKTRSSTGIAAVHSRIFPITLSNNVTFESNKGSGIKLIDSSVIVSQNSIITFLKNVANFGGGISLIGFSSIVVHPRVLMNFTGNSANFQGGAIYSYAIDGQPQGLCFIEQEQDMSGLTLFNRPKFYFNNNNASHTNSNSLYISSLVPCTSQCGRQSSYFRNLTIEIFQDCLGDFVFAEDEIEMQVTTAGNRLDFNDSRYNAWQFIPGKMTKLPIVVYDEFDSETVETFLLTVESNGSLLLKYSYTSINEVNFIGRPGETGILEMNSRNYQNLAARLNVALTECPPGFVIKKDECVCSAQIQDDHYNSILHCNSESMTSFISFGFWVGYMPEPGEKAGEDNLYTAMCPLGYCRDSNKDKNIFRIELPGEASEELLDEYICGSQKRTGILCGDCVDNHSIYFHSWNYKCGHSELCDYGVLFYFLSEILPITLAFSVIIILGIDFTSGKFNGLILFAQLTQSLSIMANGAIIYSNTEKIFYDISVIFYGPFNLNFFKIDWLSFCIFKGATFLTIIFMEFLTLVYAFLLVISLVYLMRSRCCYKLHIACFRIGLTKTASLTKGLTAFFIICYSQATRLCYQVLNVGLLKGKGEKHLDSLRIFRMGSLEYFSGLHIPFTIGAILILLTVVLIPPILLLVYPIMYRILPENFQKKKPVQIVLYRIEKYRPLFDSFQGCFQDKHRYFVGIHFLYRSAFITVFAFISTRLVIFTINEIIAIVVLFLHLWMQPYKKARHNLIDGLLYLLIAIINMLTLWRYILSYVQIRPQELLAVGIVQIIFLYLPLLSIVMLFFHTIITRFWKKHKNLPFIKNNNMSESDISLDIVNYRVYSNSQDWENCSSDFNYKEFEN